MEKRIAVMLLLAVAATSQASAQGDDFGIWTEANVEKKISRNLTIDGGVELRTRDDGFGEIDRWSFGLGATYKLTPWLKVSAGYTLLDDNNHKEKTTWGVTSKKGLPKKKYTNAEYWGVRHRFNVSLTASKDFGDLSLSLRERWQYTYRPEKAVSRWYERYEYYYYNSEDDFLEKEDDYEEGYEDHVYRGKGSNKWRNRLQLKYKLSKQWRPYLSAESTVGGSGLDKMRYALGTEIRLTKQHSLDVKYLYQHTYGDDDEEGNRHVLGIGYSYKF